MCNYLLKQFNVTKVSNVSQEVIPWFDNTMYKEVFLVLFPVTETVAMVKPHLHDTAGCQTGCQTGCQSGLTTGLTTGCIHDKTGCQTGMTTGLTAGCISCKRG